MFPLKKKLYHSILKLRKLYACERNAENEWIKHFRLTTVGLLVRVRTFIIITGALNNLRLRVR